MANYIDQYVKIAPSTVQMHRTPEPSVVVSSGHEQRTIQPMGANVLEQYLQNQGIVNVSRVKQVENNAQTSSTYKNDLRTPIILASLFLNLVLKSFL